MRIRLLNVVLLAAAVFAVSRLWLFLGQPPPSLPAITSGAAQPAAVTAERGPQAEVGDFRPEAYDAIVARDLFSATRGVVAAAPAAAARPVPKPAAAPKLTLYGVVIMDGEKTAYLQEGNQEGRPRKVRENEGFAGGVLKSIRPDGVTFLFADSEITVPLRAPKAGAGTSSAGGKDAGGVAPRSEAPVAFPRRQSPAGIQPGQMPAGVQPGQMPTPGRPTAAPGMPSPFLPGELGGEVIKGEEFPEGIMPGGDMPGMPEEEAAE